MKLSLGAAAGLVACAAVLVDVSCAKAQAGSVKITSRLENRTYRVYGKTARALVTFMKRRPFRGDHGPAMANIRVRYRLDVDQRLRAGRCAVGAVRVEARFVMTLPRAVQRRAFSRVTRRAWTRFRAFTRRHELSHKRIALRCLARAMGGAARAARRMSCVRSRTRLRRALQKVERSCEAHHRAFDRRELRRVARLSLFRLARSERRLALGRAARTPPSRRQRARGASR